MPKIFSDEDRKVIRKNLLEIGRSHFLRRGLRSARIEEIAAEAGIGKGTFYAFFDSKEDLCLEIYEVEEERIGQDILATLSGSPDPKTALRAVLALTLSFLTGDSLLRRLQENGEYALLGRGVRSEKLQTHQNNDLRLAALILKHLDAMGATVQIDPSVLAGILRAYTMLIFHRQEIGESVFEDTMNALAEAIVLRVLQPKGSK